MIEFLSLLNFQPHRKYLLELDPLLTVVVGKSDQGKSSLLRSLRWLATNRPLGDDFIQHGRSGTTVRLGVDGKEIARKKGKEVNVYEVGEEKYAAFGTGVPDDIQSLLNLSDVCFQRQFDSPFWFTLSPGEVSKELNRIVHLDLIDSTLANLASELRKARSDEEAAQDRLEASRKHLEALEWLDGADFDLKALEDLEGQLRVLEAREKDLGGLLGKIEESEKLASQSIPVEAVLKLEELESSWSKMNEEYQSLSRLLDNVQEAERALCQAQKEAKQLEQELQKHTQGKCPLCQQLLRF